MPWPVLNAGQRLTAQMLSDMQWQGVTNGIAQTVNNSAVLVNTNLVLPALAGATYLFELRVSLSGGNSAADFAFAWTVPNNGSVGAFTAGIGAANTSVTADDANSATFRRPATGTVRRVGATTLANSYFESGIIIGGDGGPVTFQFAQGTATAVDSVLTSSSRLDWIRIA